MKKNEEMLKKVADNLACDLTKNEEFQIVVELGRLLSDDLVDQDALFDWIQPLVFRLVESMSGGHRNRVEYMCKELPHVFKLSRGNLELPTNMW